MNNVSAIVIYHVGCNIRCLSANTKLAITCPNNIEPLPDKLDPNLFAAAGVRIQNFGREASQRRNAALEIVASEMTCRVCSRNDSAFLTLSVLENENLLETLQIPSNSLAADFVFGVNGSGQWTVTIHSLVDSRPTSVSGDRKGIASSAVEFSYRLVAENAPVEATIDDLVIGRAVQESKTAATPFKIDLVPQFDPVQAGWKKVFDEEFEGDRVDTSNWYFRDSPTATARRATTPARPSARTKTWMQAKP